MKRILFFILVIQISLLGFANNNDTIAQKNNDYNSHNIFFIEDIKNSQNDVEIRVRVSSLFHPLRSSDTIIHLNL